MADEHDRFNEVISEALSEPFLGPRQSALVDALISRLGSPATEDTYMSEADFATAVGLAQILNLKELAEAMRSSFIDFRAAGTKVDN